MICNEAKLRELCRLIDPTEEPDMDTMENVDRAVGLTITELADGEDGDAIVRRRMDWVRDQAALAGMGPDSYAYETSMARAYRLNRYTVDMARAVFDAS